MRQEIDQIVMEKSTKTERKVSEKIKEKKELFSVSESGEFTARNLGSSDDFLGQIVIGDSRKSLKTLPDNFIQTCITSPPYWGLRDYGTDGQIGAEKTIDKFIADLVDIFREVRRAMMPDGTLWLNIGDSFTSGGRTWRDVDKKNKGRAMDYRAPTPDGLKPKDLIGIPWRVALVRISAHRGRRFRLIVDAIST